MDASGTGDARLAAALAASRDAVVVLEATTPSGDGADFVVVAQNARGPELQGTPVGGRLRETIPAVIAGPLAQMCARTLADGEPRRDQARAGVARGSVEWVDRQVVRLSSTQVALTLRDVTGERHDHDRLREAAAVSAALAAEQAGLRRAAEAVAHAAPPESVIALVAEEAVRRMGADEAHVVRFDADAIVTVGSFGSPGPTRGARFPKEGHRSIAQVARTGRTTRVDDYAALRRVDPVSARVVPEDLGSGLTAPIRAGARLWGGLIAVRLVGGSPFTEADERRLERLADLIGLAVANAEIQGRLRALAATDPLTGLANHRAFQEHLVQEVARAHRYGQPLSLVLLDLDHFKRVNDAHGHQAGDAVLAEVGGRLLVGARTGDLMARVGGEEFAWLLPATDVAGAEALAERARRSVGVLPFPTVGALTASLGVAELGPGDDGQALFRNADLALIWTKVSGRNRSRATRRSWRGGWRCAGRSCVPRGSPGVSTPSGRSRSSWMRATPTGCATPSGSRARRGRRGTDRVESPPARAAPRGRPRPRRREDLGARGGAPAAGSARRARPDRVQGHAVVGAEIASRALTPRAGLLGARPPRAMGRPGVPRRARGRGDPRGGSDPGVADAWEAMTSAPRMAGGPLAGPGPGRDERRRGNPVLAPGRLGAARSGGRGPRLRAGRRERGRRPLRPRPGRNQRCESRAKRVNLERCRILGGRRRGIPQRKVSACGSEG